MDPRDKEDKLDSPGAGDDGSSAPSPSAPEPESTATYLDKVVMFIPASLNLAYVAALGIMAD
ncbi:MAG: hypothetical protein AB7M93_15960, partial [Candidatus Obscuribacterales bacterium]